VHVRLSTKTEPYIFKQTPLHSNNKTWIGQDKFSSFYLSRITMTLACLSLKSRL